MNTPKRSAGLRPAVLDLARLLARQAVVEHFTAQRQTACGAPAQRSNQALPPAPAGQ